MKVSQKILKSSYRRVKNMLAMVSIAAYNEFARSEEGAELGAGAGAGGVVELSGSTTIVNLSPNEQWGTMAQIKYLGPGVSREIVTGLNS
uniref:Uncharacterized protein n=1 Tax=Cucumis melo TaxID=3656 RepID=A0A9I9CJA8_CUCME